MAANNILCQNKVDPACNDLSYSKCPHCSLDLCLEHINEHQHLVRIQFNEMIDQINEQKAESTNHSTIDEMRVKAVAALDAWKENKIEIVMAIYNAERFHIENICEQSITEKSRVQNVAFEELNTASNSIDKKKNVHPSDILQLEQKLNELKTLILKIHENTNAELTHIVTNIILPETTELNQHLKNVQEKLKTMSEEYKQKMAARDKTISGIERDLLNLRQTIIEKDDKIARLRQTVRNLRK